jgi:hypothetical protein
LPLSEPVDVGWNATPIVHDCPGLSTIAEVQVVSSGDSEKSPVKLHPWKVIGFAFFFCGLESTTLLTLLVASVATFPNFTVTGVNLRAEGTGVSVAVGVAVAVAVDVAVAVAVAVRVAVAVTVGVAVAVEVRVGVAVLVAVAVAVRVVVGVAAVVGVGVGVAVPVDDEVPVAVAV